MARRLPVRHAGSPLVTNAMLNRKVAVRCFDAGMTPRQIATAWPEVFKVTVESGVEKLGQKYDYELADGSGRFEANRRITEASARAVLARFKRQAKRAAATDEVTR